MTKHYGIALNFAKNKIYPLAKELDENSRFPKELFEEIGKSGFLKILIPKEYGGEGLTVLEHIDICRAFSRYCPSVALCYMMHNVALQALIHHASKELKEEIFSSVVKNNKFLALAYSELGYGTHFSLTESTIVDKGDFVILNGLKSMVTSGNYANYYLTNTKSCIDGCTDDWFIPLCNEGVEFLTDTWKGMGMKANVSCQMKLEDAKISKKYRIGEEGKGSIVDMSAVPYFIIGLAGVYAGLCEGIFEEAKEHSINRKYPDGKSLAEIETVQIHLSKLYSMSFSSVSVTNEAGKSILNNDEDFFTKLVSARIISSESAIECGRIAMRIGGGKAYNGFGNLERYLRDSYASQIMAPSVDVLNIMLGKAVTGQE